MSIQKQFVQFSQCCLAGCMCGGYVVCEVRCKFAMKGQDPVSILNDRAQKH